MAECRQLADLPFEPDGIAGQRLAAHLEKCPACRDQVSVDRELRLAFRGIAQPSLSLRFDRDLRARLGAERGRRRHRRRCLLVMQAYWAAASVATVLALLLTRWPAQAPSPLVTGAVGTISALALLTVVVLLRSLRIGIVDLILGTVRLFGSQES